jgi:DNA-binding transcriptional ArsR family regulator
MYRSPKFYCKSLTLLLPILKSIEEGLIASEIAQRLNLSKQHVSYHISKLKGCGYIKENGRDVFKVLELTQAGKNFLAMYQHLFTMPICRAENIRFKASVYKMPSIQIGWHTVEMRNWKQYTTQVDCVKVKLNDGENPTIEFLPGPIDGNDPIKLYCSLVLDCNDVAKNLEQTLDMRIGRLELSSKGEWVYYTPVAKAITEKIGRVTVEGIGKINASLPGRFGEFEFCDPRAAAEFLDLPRRVARLEHKVDKLLECRKFQENN